MSLTAECDANTRSQQKSVNETYIEPGHQCKTLPANAGNKRDMSSIPGLGRSPGGGDGNPLQYSYLRYSMNRGAWWATVHMVAKSWT